MWVQVRSMLHDLQAACQVWASNDMSLLLAFNGRPKDLGAGGFKLASLDRLKTPQQGRPVPRILLEDIQEHLQRPTMGRFILDQVPTLHSGAAVEVRPSSLAASQRILLIE